MEKIVLKKEELAKLPMRISSLNHHAESGSFFLKVKDEVAVNAAFAKPSQATGTIWLSTRGNADMLPHIEAQLKAHYKTDSLIGTTISKAEAEWGDNVPVSQNGEELTGVYDVTIK